MFLQSRVRRLGVFVISILCITPQSRSQNPSNAPLESGVAVTGLTLTENGTAVAGADVYLLRRGTYYGRLDPRKVQSDAAGYFKFDGVADGEYRLWAAQGNLISRDQRTHWQTVGVTKASGPPQPMKLSLIPGRVLHATVARPDGQPIAAIIRLPRSDTGFDFPTDPNGRRTIEGLTAEPWEVQAFAPGRAKVTKTVGLSNDVETSIDFVLADGGSIGGKVVDSAGRAIAGAGLNIYPDGVGTPIDYVTSAADGTYRFDNLPLDQDFSFYVSHDAYVTKSDRTPRLTSAERQRDFTFTLEAKPPGGSIAGKVTDTGGNPIAGASVTHYGGSSREVKTVTTDFAGAYRLDDLQRREVVPNEVVIRAPGWAPVAIPVEKLGSAGAPARFDVQLVEKGHRISGRLVSDRGEPIKGASIEGGHRTAGDNRAVSTTTDAEGRFQFDTLRSDATFDIWADGYTSVDWMHVPLDQEGEVTVVLQRMGAIVGKVVDAETGAPLPKFNIRTRMNGISSRREEAGEDFGGGTGEFRLDDLRTAEKAMLAISAGGYPTQYFEQITPTPGGNGEPIIFALSRNPPGYHQIAGRIMDAQGKPIAGVEVRAVSYGVDDRNFPEAMRFDWGMLKSGQLNIQGYIRVIESTRTADNGTFSFASVPGPEVDLAYWAERVPQARMKNIAGMAQEQLAALEIRVAPPATVAGTINAATYPSVSSLTLRSTADPSMQIEIRLKENASSYVFPTVPAGTYELRIAGKMVNNDDGTFHYPEIGKVPVTVQEGSSVELNLGPRESARPTGD